MIPPWERNATDRQTPVSGYRPPWTADEWRHMERMRAAGIPVAVIARRLGRSRLAVSIAWSRYGPSPEYQRLMAFLGLARRTIAKGLKMVNDDPDLLRVVQRPKRRIGQYGRCERCDPDPDQAGVSGGAGERA